MDDSGPATHNQYIIAIPSHLSWFILPPHVEGVEEMQEMLLCVVASLPLFQLPLPLFQHRREGRCEKVEWASVLGPVGKHMGPSSAIQQLYNCKPLFSLQSENAATSTSNGGYKD